MESPAGSRSAHPTRATTPRRSTGLWLERGVARTAELRDRHPRGTELLRGGLPTVRETEPWFCADALAIGHRPGCKARTTEPTDHCADMRERRPTLPCTDDLGLQVFLFREEKCFEWRRRFQSRHVRCGSRSPCIGRRDQSC